MNIEDSKPVKIGLIRRTRSWAVEIVLAGLTVFLVTEYVDRANLKARSGVPAAAWFQVNEVFVPDHAVGANPEMLYDITIIQPFRGFFVAEVQKQQPDGLWFSQCSGSGASDYDFEDVIPDRTVSWSWFLNRDCVVPAGVYRIRVSYEMKRQDWPVKSVVALSNIFTVSD